MEKEIHYTEICINLTAQEWCIFFIFHMTLLIFREVMSGHKNCMTMLHKTWLLARNDITPSLTMSYFLLKLIQLSKQKQLNLLKTVI